MQRLQLNIADVPVALLAGGLATRLGNVSATIPKAMVDVAGRPFIDHQLLLLRSRGIRRIVLCLGHLGQQIEQHLGDGASCGLSLSYSHDGPTLVGTGGALRRAMPMLGPVFWVMYGDSYMDIDYRAVLARFADSDAGGLMTVIRNDDCWDRSNAVFEEGRLSCYDKIHRTPDMRYIDYGVQLLRASAVESLLTQERCDLADIYRTMVSQGRMIGHEVHDRFYEIGTPAALEETRRHLATPARVSA